LEKASDLIERAEEEYPNDVSVHMAALTILKK